MRTSIDVRPSIARSVPYIRGDYIHIRGDYIHIRGDHIHIRGDHIYIRGDHIHIRGDHATTCTFVASRVVHSRRPRTTDGRPYIRGVRRIRAIASIDDVIIVLASAVDKKPSRPRARTPRNRGEFVRFRRKRDQYAWVVRPTDRSIVRPTRPSTTTSRDTPRAIVRARATPPTGRQTTTLSRVARCRRRRRR